MHIIKNKLKYIIILIILIIVLSFFIYYYCSNNSVDEVIKEDEPIQKEVKERKEEKIYFMVDIKGAVNNPGVYKLEENSRIMDVINASGGLKDNADTFNINLSKKIKDEMFIVIYTKDEIEKYKKDNVSTDEINKKLEKEIVYIDKNNDAQIKQNTGEVQKGKININTASKEELLTITGIGESKADSIIKYKSENGNFEKIEDIKNVSGIGEALFEKIKDYITI